MKLIDLLVRELPKRGGWPDGSAELYWHKGASFAQFYKVDGIGSGKALVKTAGVEYSGDCEGEQILKTQYEAALAASKLQWDGEGLPPVGCECMVRGEIGDDGWYECKIIAHTFFDGYNCAVFQTDSTVSCSSDGNFRLILSEADKKRDASIAAIDLELLLVMNSSKTAEVIYDAIAAGKIPGVKLEG